MPDFRLFGCPNCSHTFASNEDAPRCPLCQSATLSFTSEVPGPVASGSKDAPAGDTDPLAEPEHYVFGVICPHCERGVEIELTDNLIEARIPAGTTPPAADDAADDAAPASPPGEGTAEQIAAQPSGY